MWLYTYYSMGVKVRGLLAGVAAPLPLSEPQALNSPTQT